MTGLARDQRYADLKAKGRDLLRHPAILELRGKKIGPAFPRDEGAGPLQGMRGVPRKATKRPFGLERQRARRPKDAVTATCLSCPWRTSGRTWRPVRRRLAEHTAKKHPTIVQASRSAPDDSTAVLGGRARGGDRTPPGAPDFGAGRLTSRRRPQSRAVAPAAIPIDTAGRATG